MEIDLPGGEIMTMNFVQFDSGSKGATSGPPAAEGHKQTGVIVGGTGKYIGIKGSYEYQVYANKKTRIVFNIM